MGLEYYCIEFLMMFGLWCSLISKIVLSQSLILILFFFFLLLFYNSNNYPKLSCVEGT